MEEQTVDFVEFAKFLFSNPPEPPKSVYIGVEFKDDSDMGTFLQDLFCFGYKHKFGNVPLNKVSEYHFNVLREYILSIGFEATLIGYQRNDANEITNFDVAFKAI